MSKFDGGVGLGARESERRPAARAESALSIGPGFSLDGPGGGESLLPGCGDFEPPNDERLGLPELAGEWPNHMDRRGAEKGMVIRE